MSSALPPDPRTDPPASAADQAPDQAAHQPSDPAAGSPPGKIPAGSSNFLRLKKRYGIFGGSEIGPVLRKLPAFAAHLVEGLIPRGSVNVLVGDSGIGKSALAYQLGLAVAAGTPFLDMPVTQGKVLLVDFENSLADAHWIMEQQRKHLGLTVFPHTFQLWPMLLDPLREKIEEVVAMLSPDLVILDSLRSFNPKMEGENSAAVGQIKRLRATAARQGTAFLLIHHVRKHHAASHGRSPASLAEGDVMDWLLRAAGVRAIINQMDVRLALSLLSPWESGLELTSRSTSRDGAPLILRGHFRTRGEVGPFLLRRKWAVESQEATDGTAGSGGGVRLDGAGRRGEPLGYERYTVDSAASQDRLRDKEREVFARLPKAFSFKDARLLHGKAHQSTNVLIHKLMRLGLVFRMGRGQYRKAGGSGERLAA